MVIVQQYRVWRREDCQQVLVVHCDGFPELMNMMQLPFDDSVRKLVAWRVRPSDVIGCIDLHDPQSASASIPLERSELLLREEHKRRNTTDILTPTDPEPRGCLRMIVASGCV